MKKIIIVTFLLLLISCNSSKEQIIRPKTNNKIQNKVSLKNTQTWKKITNKDADKKNSITKIENIVTKPTPKKCTNFLNKINNYDLFAAWEYSGLKVDYQIDDSWHNASLMNLKVNYSKNPIVLMLWAYEPSIWNIIRSENTEIVWVILSGYHKQIIMGLPKDIPILNNIECDNLNFYISKKTLGSLNIISKKILNKKVDKVYLAKNWKIEIGTPYYDNINWIEDINTKPEDFAKKELSWIPWLEQAVEKGILRKATLDDAYAWVDAISENYNKDLPSVEWEIIKPSRPLLLNAYVILKPFTFPWWLYWWNSATFFIPKWIEKPKWNWWHSNIYNFNTLECIGTLCNR